MKILIASNYMPPHLGGIEYAAESLKRCWERAGHHVTWIASAVDQKNTEDRPDLIKVPALNFIEDFFEINTPVFTPSILLKLGKLVRAHDVINTHSLAPGLSLAVLEAALRNKRPTVVTQHVGVIELKSGIATSAQRRIIPALARHALKKGALMTFVSPAVRDWFIENTGHPEDRFRITPAGIDNHNFHFVDDIEKTALKAKWNLPENRMSVLFVGRFIEKKGVPLLKIVTEQCSNTVFTFLGSGPIDLKKEQIPNLRVLDHVTTTELRELYGAHDLFIMPSFGEGWPAVVPQAMACGLPCLISKEAFTGHNRNEEFFIIRDRVPAEFIKAINDATSGLLPIMKKRKEISSYAVKEWSWEHTSAIYTTLFEEQMQGSGSSDKSFLSC